MTLKSEAVYENGVLRPTAPLPLREHQKVEVVIQAETSWTEQTTGILRWIGDPADLRRIAEDDEFGILGMQ
jgi:predicted DNA-binding antitoxin AbrB/MazE fold protein